jgi:hypothetical protein
MYVCNMNKILTSLNLSDFRQYIFITIFLNQKNYILLLLLLLLLLGLTRERKSHSKFIKIFE